MQIVFYLLGFWYMEMITLESEVIARTLFVLGGFHVGEQDNLQLHDYSSNQWLLAP